MTFLFNAAALYRSHLAFDDVNVKVCPQLERTCMDELTQFTLWCLKHLELYDLPFVCVKI